MTPALRINFVQVMLGVAAVLIHATEGVIVDGVFKPFAADVNVSSAAQAALNENPAWTDADLLAAVRADARYSDPALVVVRADGSTL